MQKLKSMKIFGIRYFLVFFILITGCGIWNSTFTTNEKCEDFLTFYGKKIETSYSSKEIFNKLIEEGFEIQTDTIWSENKMRFAPLIHILNYNNPKMNLKILPKMNYVELHHIDGHNHIRLTGICLNSPIEITKEEAKQISELVYADFVKILN